MILSIPVFETMGTGRPIGYNDMGTGTSPACQKSRVRVWNQVRGYRYKLPYPDKYHDYGFNLQNQLSVTSNTGTPVVHTK